MNRIRISSRLIEGDKIVWIISFLLMFISVLLVYSTTSSLAYRLADGNTEFYLLRHIGFVAVAIIAIFISHKIDYNYYSKISRLGLLLSIPLLLTTWMFGTTLNEASRWLTIPIINKTFQPSDLAKLALITNLASMLAKRQADILNFNKALIQPLIWSGIICGLIGTTDWSTASLLFLTCLLLLFIGRIPVKHLFILLLLIGGLSGTFAFSFGQRGKTVYNRLEVYLRGTQMPYQEEQAKIAIATGGIMGKGIGKSTQKDFLPHPYSDFIFAIILEEYGILGGVLVIILYLSLLYRGIIIAAKSQNTFGALLALGMVLSIVLQAFVNMAVVVGLFPITGLPLPLISMGGTSILLTALAIGILLSVSRTSLAREIKQRGS